MSLHCEVAVLSGNKNKLQESKAIHITRRKCSSVTMAIVALHASRIMLLLKGQLYHLGTCAAKARAQIHSSVVQCDHSLFVCL